MGYLNNSTRILDAILTKKGREILSSGGNFEVSKFALGDDEVDYALWDTTHTQGTDYYGAVIDNLPALEPFNDPSEIMKYKLVTRQTEGCRAMAKLNALGQTAAGLAGLAWVDGETTDKISIAPPGMSPSQVGTSTATISIAHHDNTVQFPQGTDYALYATENYTVTLLDASVAVLAPAFSVVANNEVIVAEGNAQSGPEGSDDVWFPFIDNVQHLSQTISGVARGGGSTLQFPGGDLPVDPRNLVLYPKQVSATSTTSLVITGELSGAVKEFPVTVTFSS